MPIVRLMARDGVPVHFTLDTGAQETFFTDVLLRKVKVRTFFGGRRLVSGFSGQQRVRGRFITSFTSHSRASHFFFERFWCLRHCTRRS